MATIMAMSMTMTTTTTPTSSTTDADTHTPTTESVPHPTPDLNSDSDSPNPGRASQSTTSIPGLPLEAEADVDMDSSDSGSVGRSVSVMNRTPPVQVEVEEGYAGLGHKCRLAGCLPPSSSSLSPAAASSSSSDPYLPPELERYILQLASSHPNCTVQRQTVWSLLFVCHRFSQWVEPFLYTHIHLTPDTFPSFLKAFKRKPREFFTSPSPSSSSPPSSSSSSPLLAGGGTGVRTLSLTQGIDWFTSQPILRTIASTQTVQSILYLVEKPGCGEMVAMQSGLPFPLREVVSGWHTSDGSKERKGEREMGKGKEEDGKEKRKSRLRRLTIRVESGALPLGSGRSSGPVGNPYAFDLSPYSKDGPLSRLTHLEILSSSSSSSSSTSPSTFDPVQKMTLFKGYETLPCLTHLAIDAWTRLTDVKRLFLPRRQVQLGGQATMKSRLRLVVLLARSEGRASATRRMLSESESESEAGSAQLGSSRGGGTHWGVDQSTAGVGMGDGWDRELERGIVVFPWSGMPRTLVDGMDGWSWVEWFAFRMESAMRP